MSSYPCAHAVHTGSCSWGVIASSCIWDMHDDTITPMEKYVAENAKLEVVEVMPLMRILLADAWVPSIGEMPVVGVEYLA